MKIQFWAFLALILGVFPSCERESQKVVEPYFIEDVRNLRRQISAFGTALAQKDTLELSQLIPLHEPMNASNLTDWERRFRTDPQNLITYLDSNPIRPTSERPFIYIGKLGTFSPAQNEIFHLTCLYLQGFFGCEVRFLDSIPLSVIPAHAQRFKNGENQLYTSYILDKLLKPRLPDSVLNGLLLTSSDLFPSTNWNYVFGQASLKNRVGVWSMNRFGNPDASRETFDICLKRTLKTAAHETGHMFSMTHCTFYFCTMQGAYHLQEADERPMHVCPVCLSKIVSGGHINVLKRFEYLEKFWTILGFKKESEDYRRFIHTITP